MRRSTATCAFRGSVQGIRRRADAALGSAAHVHVGALFLLGVGLRVRMAHLRKKIGHDAARPRHLRTEAGVGHRFVP